jgi:hypothetical protein
VSSGCRARKSENLYLLFAQDMAFANRLEAALKVHGFELLLRP